MCEIQQERKRNSRGLRSVQGWQDFATIHEALALNELGRGDEAIPILEEAIAFRKRRYGPDDTESFK